MTFRCQQWRQFVYWSMEKLVCNFCIWWDDYFICLVNIIKLQNNSRLPRNIHKIFYCTMLYNFFCSISVSAWNFEYDNLYISFFLDIPPCKLLYFLASRYLYFFIYFYQVFIRSALEESKLVPSFNFRLVSNWGQFVWCNTDLQD